MPINKYMIHVDGKDHQVSEENIQKYGMGKYASSYPDATVRMRDADGADFDIPIGEYDKAVSSGLHPFITTFYESDEQIDAINAGDSIADMPSVKSDSIAISQPAVPPTPVDSMRNVPTDSISSSIEANRTMSDGYDADSQTFSGGAVSQEQADSIFDAKLRERKAQQRAQKSENAVQEKQTPPAPAPDVWKDMPNHDFVSYQAQQRANEEASVPMRAPETERSRKVREALEQQNAVQQIWEGELKGKVDQLIAQGREEGRRKLAEYKPTVYGRSNFGYGVAGMDDRWGQEYLKATDSKKVIDGVQQYLAEKQGKDGEGRTGGATEPNPMQEKLMQKVYDYLVEQHTPRSTAEYILRNVMDASILGQIVGMGNGKSYEQRQIEAGGLQQYQPSAAEEIGAMAASIGTDLPVMAVTGAVGGLAGNAFLKSATNRLMASGLSRAAAQGIAVRAAQQTAMKNAIRVASEAVNFGTLEGLGSVVGQAYQTGDVDFGKAAIHMAKGAYTGAVMGIFGVSNDKFRKLMEGGLGETAGRSLGYASSLGGRTAILTGSSVFGQYLEDPNFDINNVDWTKEVAHAALMNIGFDILGAVKQYQAYRKTGVRMRDLDKLHLTKEDIEQLNRAGIKGNDAQEIAESILQVKDAKALRQDTPEGEGLVSPDYGFASQELGFSKEGSVLGQLLSNTYIDLSTKAKIAYLMTGMKFRLAPNTNVSDVQEQADGSFTVEKFNPGGQTNETHRFQTREEAEKYRYDTQNEVMPNQVSVLEGMMDNAGKVSTATRICDMVAKMYNVSKEQIAEVYARGRQGEELTAQEAQAYKTISDLFKSVQSSEDYHYSTNQLKSRMDEAYGQENGWMDKVLKKKYNSLNETERRAYDEYINNMKMTLQGNQSERAQIGGEAYSPSETATGDVRMLPGGVAVNVGEPIPAPVPSGGAPAEVAASTPREASRQLGAALYAEHDPVKMRQAVVREEVARERALAAVGSEEALERLGELDEAALEEAVAGMDANTQRLVGDWIAQKELVDGMDEALDAAHEAEIEEAERKVLSMAPIADEIPLVPLGKYGDSEHTYGVVVSGIDASRQLTNPSGLAVVVPLTNGPTGAPDYNSFDPTNTLSGTFTNDAVRWEHREDVIVSMLPSYEADASLLDEPAFVPGTTVQIADVDGNVANLHILAQGPGDSWIVQEEGMNGGMEVPEEELAEMMAQAERLPILQEYAELDKAYEREQRESQRQAERQAEREARQAREAEEAARIAEEMKKPINRLAKYPEGHQNAGKPDYENSRPEDVREYLVESLGLESAVKSIRSQRAGLERQVSEQRTKLDALIRENGQNDYYPDEAIAAQQYISTQQQELDRLKKRLSFWQNMEDITAGPSEKAIQETVARSQATQKATRTKRDTYKPSDAYVKLKKEISDSSTALDVLNDLEPHTPEELAATLISGGVRLMKGDETVGGVLLKGVMSMTGYGQRDLNRLNFIFASRDKGGISVSEFGELMESTAQEYGIRFDGKTQEEGVTALLNLLGEVEKMGDITRYVERNRMEEATAFYDAETAAMEEAMDAAAWKEYGMSYADLQKLQSAITELLAERKGFYEEFEKTEAYNDFMSNFAKSIDYGQEGNDNTGIEAGFEEAGNDVAGGNGRAVAGNQAPAGSLQPVAEVAGVREPQSQDQRGTSLDGTADGSANGIPVSSGQGTGNDAGLSSVSTEQIEQAKQLAQDVVAEVKKEIQGKPVYVAGSLEDIEKYKKIGVGGKALSDMTEGFHKPYVAASYIPDLDGIMVWAHKVAHSGMSKQRLKAYVYHENVHALLRGGRYTTDEFKAFANQIRSAFPDIAEYVDKVYGDQPESIQAEEVVARYVEDLIDSGLEVQMLAGEARIEGDTDAIGEELNHIVNLLKDRKYDRARQRPNSETGRLDDQTESGNRGTGDLVRARNGQEGSEPVQPVQGSGSAGNGEAGGMAGRLGLDGKAGSDVRSEGEGEAGYQVEKRHHAKLNQDVWSVRFTERFDRDKFLDLKKQAKKFRGYYSSYGKGGFIFEDEAHARNFAESVVGVEAPETSAIEQARAEVNTNPTEAQKEAGNYKMGHVKIDGYDITIENPKGSVRSGKDANGKEWRTTMNNDYGYIRGTKAVDGDHIDVFLSDNPEEGRVFVVDQTKQDGSFDESKVMYGFHSLEEAREAYLSNYDAGWESRIMAITEVSKEEFKKWIDSSTRKTKAFSEYKNVKAEPKKETELKPTYDEQGRATIEIQAADSNRKAEELGYQAEAGSVETALAAGRTDGTSGNRPVASGSERPSQVNGYRLGEKVVYKGQEATIYDFEKDGTPVLDTGMGPIIYEVGRWEDIQKLPASREQAVSMAQARTPEKQLERAEQRQQREKPKREKQKAQMADLFAQADALDEVLTRQEQEIDAQLALMVEYKAGPKAQVREDMHTGAAKTLEKAARKLAKALANRLGGHVDGKDITRGLTNIAPIGGDMTIRVWMDDAETSGVLLNISFEAAPDTKDFDKLVPKYGMWRLIAGDDPQGIKSLNVWIDELNDVSEMQSGAFMVKIADKMLADLNRKAMRPTKVTSKVLTNKDQDNDERRNRQADSGTPGTGEGIVSDGRTEGNPPADQGVGTAAREETERADRGRDGGSVHGNHVSDTEGSGRVSGSDGEQQPSVGEPSPVTASVKRNTNNWSYGESHLELPSGEIGKLKGNIEAIRTLKELEASGQPATPEQKQALLKFVGWGGLAEALNSAEYADWKSRQKNASLYGWGESLSTTPWGKKWGKHYEELRPLMTDEEWATAQASTLNSHYTPETVIRGLWQALEYMGFKGGSIQEPAMGIGHILGFMPKSISERSLISGFELDSIPGRIAKQLYPDADITVAGYETVFRPSSKDAIVTNVPFGQTAPVDPALDKALRKKIGGAYNLHNYFIVKGLLELRPGGVGAFITSAATLDGRNTKAREYIASLGVDLVGAIRLPNNTFKSNAGTEVTADILFFRKRLPGESGNGIAFTSLAEVGTGTYKGRDKQGNEALLEVPLLVNEYFAEHPEMMLGTVMTAHDAGSGGLYGGDNLTLVARPGTELSAELADAIGRLPEGVYGKTFKDMALGKKEATTQKDGTLSVKDGHVYVASKGELTEIASGSFKHNGKARSYADATQDYQALKETLKELIQAEQTQVKDPTELRKQLNEQYDRFVEKYGHLNDNKNLNVVLEEDPERFLPQALEKVETVTNPTTGRRTKVVSKGDGILAKRVSQPMTEPTTAETLSDAIGISQAYRGHMDVDYIANMLGIQPDEARERILEAREAYVDPITGDLVDRDAYLSGNIREKLDSARSAAEKDARYESNVADLEKAMPDNIPFVDIFYKMGTPWIPVDVYETFALEVCGIKDMEIRYSSVIDQFVVVNKGYITDHTKANNFATDRRDVKQIFEDGINLRKPTVYDTVYEGNNKRQVKNEAATQAAISAIMDMNDAFIQYIQNAKDQHARLANIYNDRYNNYRLREYREPSFKGADGKVHYPNANPGITLRTHQVKAVQRSLQGSTLLAHQVGTGKTFTMITTAMEMRRLGLAKKPMIVVQNATLQDFASDFMKLYPGAKILVPNENERSASQRKRLFNLIATGDFDAIIVPQSFLAFIPDDEGRKKALIQARVDEILAAADELSYTDKSMSNRLKREAEALSLSLSDEGGKSGGKSKRVKDQAKQQEKAVVREIKKLDRRTDDVLTFEQMGIDALFIDEAHNYKKIGFTTKMQNVKGIDTGYSERANSLYLKVSYVQEKMGGRNVILATGTPITNTMAEVWTMMRFVAPEILEDYGIRTFDEFAATFGQVEPSLEQNSTGGFKIADRFKSYVNVPELVKAFRSHADVVLTSDVEEFKQSKNIPKLKDGRMTNHVIQKSDQLQEVMDVLIEALKEDEKKSGNDKTPGLPLVVFSKAKQAAIDLRLINPEYPDDPESKTNKVVSEVLRIYRESTPDKGIQMIFCDSYQSPASEPAIDLFDYDPTVPQFNLYRDIKQKLIAAGIPKDEIVIVSEISNADRKKAVFEKARAGEVRVLIGGTEKMGVGVNVQDRMIALHHMDAPIRPMDFEQRNGRILRQGNMFAAMDKPVEVVTYGVEGTLDATAYERLRIKQDFINQMMKGDVSGRVMEEQDDEDPSGKTFSQMAAELSGDKTLQLLFIAENDVKKLEGLRRSFELRKENARMDIAFMKSSLVGWRRDLKRAERLAQSVAERFPEGITQLTINGKPVTEKMSKELADMLERYEDRYSKNRSVVFPVVLLNNGDAKIVFGHTLGQLQYSLYVDEHALVEEKPIHSYAGVWLSVNSALGNTGKRVKEIEETIADYESRIKGAESLQDKEFDKMDELNAARQEVKNLKDELAKKAEKPVPSAEEVKLAKKNLKSGEKPVSLPEEMAGDSEESLDRMETAMQPFESVAVNAPEMVIAQSTSELLKAMPGIGSLQFAAIVREASRPEVQAMYVPWTRQIILLPNKGTVKEMRDKRWHESLHFGIDMVLPKDDSGRLMLERAGSEVDQLSPELAAWVKDTYGDRDVAEEKVVHLVEEFISYLEDTGKVRSLLGGVDFGSRYPVLNDVVNRVINYLTNNGHGKESDNYRGYDEGSEPTYRGEGEEGRVEEDFPTVRDGQSEEEAIIARAKADGTYMKAPNGKPTNLTEKQWVQVRTQAFKKWFGDWELPLKTVRIISSPSKISFNLKQKEATAKKEIVEWAKKNGIIKELTDKESGGKGIIHITPKSIEKIVDDVYNLHDEQLQQQSLNLLSNIEDLIRESVLGESHVGYKKGKDGKRSPLNGFEKGITIFRYFGAVDIDGRIYRAKTTVKRTDYKDYQKVYTYEVTKIELLDGKTAGEESNSPTSNNSITFANLLKGVENDNKNGDKILNSSKVVDENGEPMVVYHGTGADFDIFGDYEGYEGNTFWFAENEVYSDEFTSYGGDNPRIVKAYLNLKNPFDLRTEPLEGFPIIDKEHLGEETFAAQEDIDRLSDILGVTPDEVLNEYDGFTIWTVTQSKAFADALKSKGYDGIQFMEEMEPTWGAFEPNQIKSATDNVGTFDEAEPSIKLGLRGKPRRKQGESIVSYNRRLKEWQAEMERAKKTREVENMETVNPIDEELNDLAMEMMAHPVPIRRKGETNEAFNARQAEWSKWYNTRLPEINARMEELKLQMEKQKHASRLKEMGETDDPHYTGEVPPQKDETGELTDEEMREVRETFQEKMKDAQISVTKDQIRRDIKQEIIERRRYIETSNLEDAFFVDEVKKSAGSKDVLKAIPDYIEGTYTGEVTPELVKTAKMVSDWFEEVYNLMAQEGVLYDAPKIQNYVTHIWDWKRSPKEAQEKYANWVNTMRLRSPFTKHRVIPSYKEGIAMGMVPKYDDITGILLEYGHYATETIANKRLLEFLKNFRVFLPGGKDNMPSEMDVIVPEYVKDVSYSRMNHTALEGYKVLNIIKPYITPVFGDQRIIDPSHLNPLTNQLIDGIWATSGLMKKIALSFSFFHHGALTETAISMMKPWNAAKVIGKNLIWDVITKGNIPAMNNKDAARDAVKHLVSLGASNDYVTADVNNLTTKLYKFTKDKHIPVAQQAALLLDFLNKGSDKILWDTIHDGFKISSYEKMAKEVRAKAEREGWSYQELEKALDECGHLVNDTFGGLHFDILGFSPKSVRIMRALLLSPDWTLATIRQALSPFGFGKLYGDEGFWRTIGGGENPVKTRKKYGREFWITAMIFFYALMNGLNAYFRAKDEKEMKAEADEKRKTKPDYKSPYELAYPNGMKWYDYTMPGNTLSHQTHLFTGRYEDGTETYVRWGKQFRELPELFFGRDGLSFPGPMIDKMSGKANPFLSTVFEFVSGYSLSGWENQYMKDKKGWERDVARLYLLASKFVPYSVPTQEDKDFYWHDLFMPSSKGFTPGKAINYFEKAIKAGDMNYVSGVYSACVKNGLDPEKYFNAAKARIEAEAKIETLEGVETLQDAANLYDEATDVKERRRLLRYIEQQIGAQDFQAISQEELLQQAIDMRNGEMPEANANERYLRLSNSEDVAEDYRMKKNAAGLKKYYQDYAGLAAENKEAAERMLQEKRMYIEGYVVTTKYRSAINKLKKALTREGADEQTILKEIRTLRKEYFDTMDGMELK